jgi:hypothetical protein
MARAPIKGAARRAAAGATGRGVYGWEHRLVAGVRVRGQRLPTDAGFLARALARRLAREEGIFAGISTGVNVVAALQLAAELGPGQTVATVAVDTGLKCLAGNLYEG